MLSPSVKEILPHSIFLAEHAALEISHVIQVQTQSFLPSPLPHQVPSNGIWLVRDMVYCRNCRYNRDYYDSYDWLGLPWRWTHTRHSRGRLVFLVEEKRHQISEISTTNISTTSRRCERHPQCSRRQSSCFHWA